jgi:hypothetical protein
MQRSRREPTFEIIIIGREPLGRGGLKMLKERQVMEIIDLLPFRLSQDIEQFMMKLV